MEVYYDFKMFASTKDQSLNIFLKGKKLSGKGRHKTNINQVLDQNYFFFIFYLFQYAISTHLHHCDVIDSLFQFNWFRFISLFAKFAFFNSWIHFLVLAVQLTSIHIVRNILKTLYFDQKPGLLIIERLLDWKQEIRTSRISWKNKQSERLKKFSFSMKRHEKSLAYKIKQLRGPCSQVCAKNKMKSTYKSGIVFTSTFMC